MPMLLPTHFKEEGLDVQGDPDVDFTETHQVIVSVGYANGCEVGRRLEDSNIIVNYQGLPSDDGFTSSSGLRLGVSEMTRFGMKERDFEALAPLIANVVSSEKDLGDEVAGFRDRFHEMQYCFDQEILAPFKKRLLQTFWTSREPV